VPSRFHCKRREAVDLGVTHIDTADFYGPHVTNEIIREALAPYPDDVHVVTKVGAVRDDAGGWAQDWTRASLRAQVHDIRHLGLSTVDADQLAEAQAIAPVACVQNYYNLARRDDDALVELTARQGIGYVAYFPLGGFTPLQSGALGSVAARLGAATQAVALAWLLRRSPNLLVIPGTSAVGHLGENVASASLDLDDAAVAELDAIGG
jgi:pyridoxine 4-dehydrogenase